MTSQIALAVTVTGQFHTSKKEPSRAPIEKFLHINDHRRLDYLITSKNPNVFFHFIGT